MKKYTIVILIALLGMNVSFVSAQSVDIEITTNPNIDFTFNTITKYTSGIIIPNAVTLNIEAIGTQWDLYVGTITTSAGTWNNSQYYTSTGNGFPPVGILQVSFRNTSNTSNISGYVPLQDIATTTVDVIGNHQNTPDPAVQCSDASPRGTNTPGSYLTDPQCYQFKVDFKIVPGLTYKAGLYSLQVEFIVARDL